MRKVLVIGDSCIDKYIYCKTDRFCPDAPVPVLTPVEKVQSLGMAGNVADNLRALNIHVTFLTNKQNIIKARYVDNRTNHMFIRVDEGEKDVSLIDENVLKNVTWQDYDAVVISDYDKGFLDEDTINHIGKQHAVTFLDTKKQIDQWTLPIKYIKINEVELDKSIGFLHDNHDLYSKKVITTLGSKGAQHLGALYTVEEVDVRDTSGAGDTFLAALVCEYTDSLDIDKAIKFANKCSTQVVQKKGTAKIQLPL